MKESCSYCKRDAVYFAKHFGKYFCKKHLENYLLKKLKKNFYKFKLVKKGDKIKFEKNNSSIDVACSNLFTKATMGWPIEIVEKNETKIVSFLTLDDEVENILDKLTDEKIYKTSFQNKKTIYPFRNFTDGELHILGDLLQNKKTEIKKINPLTHSLGIAKKLNLLKIWDRIQIYSEPQQKNKSKSEEQK